MRSTNLASATRYSDVGFIRHVVVSAGSTLLLCCSVANAAGSASFQIPASTFDVAGGASSSSNYQIVSCVGSEIAGTGGSNSFRIDSGCGVALGFITAPVVVLEAPLPVPSLSVVTTTFLAGIMAVFALLSLRRRPRTAPIRHT
jgi:hypothetical protein